MADELYWDASYAVAMALKRAHPDARLEDVTLQRIYEWALALPEFADEPGLANDDLLRAIYQEWFEETLTL